jgi:hypothetical protein
MTARGPKKPVPNYPRLATLRAAVLGAAALTGCGFEPVEEAAAGFAHATAAAAAQPLPDAGQLLPPVAVVQDAGPPPSEFMMGDVALPNPDGGQW